MRNILRSVLTRASRALIPFVAGLGIGSLVIGPAALALVFPGQFGPRQFPTQQTHYERHVINITSTSFQGDLAQNTCVFAAGTCSIRVGALPYNAFVVRAYTQTFTACNAATTCTLAVGTTSGGGQLVTGASNSIIAVTGAVANTVVAANAGIVATGGGAAQTGLDGGFDLWLTVTFTGAAPTTGTVIFVLEYFSNNDGGCIYVPMTATAGAC
jgi:hypothetical protein